MDGDQFDGWVTRFQSQKSRRTFSASLTGLLLTSGMAESAKGKKKKKHKKKKQTTTTSTTQAPVTQCPARCPSGCCTSQFGECIQPARQGGTRCGTGGAMCHQCECKVLGDACAVNDTCCTTGIDLIGCESGRCCRGRGQLCSVNGECCPDATCIEESEFDLERRCLGLAGASCSHPTGCAGDLTCRTGRCCFGSGTFCEAASECCDATALCQVNPTPGAGNGTRCCLPEGQPCLATIDCCSGNCQLVPGFGFICVAGQG